MQKSLVVDIGGTKLHAAIINSNGEIEIDKKISTKKNKGKDGLINSLFEIIDELLMFENVPILGVASAGRIDFAKGEVYYATDNLPNWTGVKLKEILYHKYNKTVIIENDVNAAGLGEYWLGNSKSTKSSICITLGTGVAGAIIIEDKLIRGHHWSAGEIGHMIIHPGGENCNCGLNGCMEQYCSGTSLVKSYNEKAKNKISNGYEFFELIDKKDKVAYNVLNKFVDDLCLSIEMLSNTIDPEVFILGGGLIDTKDYWWENLISKLDKSPLTNIFKPKVLPAKLGNLAGLYGMAYLTLINNKM
ncbi:ROK family protein (putative glucokinase) [Helcococcus kunzii ATCC 51366]|uniref:ROK family protein (Putative glucokinase) n=1 Tax=Helcococcus kunzii ATCC 51366 TaxID=883114 RepID=H3NQ50_9FIRM|nr:ROK family protein [Helcococcus kunzii]EHR32530.1 ROK family protein (putative glucokinase) [Helcococcus kunzii ATCC 51366]MCT1796361.1 ROK family protein [Helcococcus kunzii]MCT1989411.1 ROK family protein [Helcococcus kunzii]